MAYPLIRDLRRLSLIFTSLAWAACGSTAQPPDASVGDASPDQGSDVRLPSDGEAPEVSAEAGSDTTPVGCAITGDSAFAQLVSGAGDFVPLDPQRGMVRHATVAVQAYFPGGRRPGQPLYLAMPTRYPVPGLSMRGPFVIGADGGIAASVEFGISDDLGTEWHGILRGPDRGFEGQARKNFAFGSDVGDEGDAPIDLCPAGALPAPRLSAGGAALAPHGSLWLVPSDAFDPNAVSAIKVRAGGQEIPLLVRTESVQFVPGSGIRVTAANGAFPPNLPLTVDASAFTDVMKRPFSIVEPPVALATTAVIADLTFATPPPSGAVALSQPAPVDVPGMLAVGTSKFAATPTGPARALAALGDPGAKTNARLTVGVDCDYGTLVSTAALVGAHGEATPVPLACGEPKALVVKIPATGPLWLSISVDPHPGHPQFSPTIPGRNLVEVDAIAFE